MRLPPPSRLLFILLFTCACSHAQVPRLHFLKAYTAEMLEWAAQWEADRFGLSLYPGSYEILPLDKDTAFFFGELRTPAASVRSFLLKSQDGGKTWKEVMTPAFGSQVSQVFFLDDKVGWALVLWTTESPGDVTLHATRDGGNSWRKVAEVPKRYYMGAPVSLSFSSEKAGVIKMLYDSSGDPEIDGLATLSTMDGGRSWRETRHITLEAYEKLDKEPAGKWATGHDGSQWQLQGAIEEIRILRRSKANEAWRLLCVIPAGFGYSKGEVLIQAPPPR